MLIIECIYIANTKEYRLHDAANPSLPSDMLFLQDIFKYICHVCMAFVSLTIASKSGGKHKVVVISYKFSIKAARGKVLTSTHY